MANGTTLTNTAQILSSENDANMTDNTATASTTVSVTTGSITGTLYQDSNGNGSLDTGEPGIAGATVTLDGGTNTTTGANGGYTFSGVAAGSHSVNYTVPTGYANTGTRPLPASVTANQTTSGKDFFARKTTSTSVSSNNNPSTYGGSVTFTATVTSLAGNPNNEGTVTFTDGATTLCNAVALSGSQATCSTSTLNAATHTATATYSGTTTGNGFQGSANSVSQVVNKATLNVNAVAASKTYGANDPAFSWTYSGFVGDDNAGNVTISGAANCTRVSGESVANSPYTITSRRATSRPATTASRPARPPTSRSTRRR